MRIVSLVPHATELLFALGLDEQIVGVTHECDHPPAARGLPKVTRDALPPGLSAGEIDAAVRERTLAGDSIYELDTAGGDVSGIPEAAHDLIAARLDRLSPGCRRVLDAAAVSRFARAVVAVSLFGGARPR